MGRVHKDQHPLSHGDLALSTLPATQNLTEDKQARLKQVWGRRDRPGGGRQRVRAGAGAAPHFTDRQGAQRVADWAFTGRRGTGTYYDAYLLDSGQVLIPVRSTHAHMLLSCVPVGGKREAEAPFVICSMVPWTPRGRPGQ